MRLLRHARRPIFVVGADFIILVMAMGQLSAEPWETCWVSERKADLCRAGGESAKPFRHYLSGLNWALQGGRHVFAIRALSPPERIGA